MYYLQTRYYDPEIGRFISPDSTKYLEPETINGLNLYAYCLNNPVILSDSEGNMPTLLKWIIGATIIIGAAVLTVATAGGFAAAGTALLSIFTATMAPSAASAVCAGIFAGSLILGTAGMLIGGISSGDWNWDNAATGFAIGSVVGAVIGGTWGGVHYGLQAAGKMGIRVTSKNYGKVKNHVDSFGFDNANNAMLNRINNARKIKGAEGRYFLHELKEAQLMSTGMNYNAAHEAALTFYHHNRFSLYAKDVVQMFASEFNKNYLMYWGLI